MLHESSTGHIFFQHDRNWTQTGFFFPVLIKKSFEAGGDPWESLCRIAMLKEITLESEKETHFNFTPFIFEERKRWTKTDNMRQWKCLKLLSQRSFFFNATNSQMHQLRKLQEGTEKSIKQRTPGGRKQHVKASKELQRKRSVKWNILSDVKHTVTQHCFAL